MLQAEGGIEKGSYVENIPWLTASLIGRLQQVRRENTYNLVSLHCLRGMVWLLWRSPLNFFPKLLAESNY